MHLTAQVQRHLSTPNASKWNVLEHFSVLSALDNGNFDWYQEGAALWCLCCQALSLAFSPRCADVYKETSPAHIKGFKLSPQAVAMEITLLRSLIHVWLIVFFLSVLLPLQRPHHGNISSRKQTIGKDEYVQICSIWTCRCTLFLLWHGISIVLTLIKLACEATQSYRYIFYFVPQTYLDRR